MHIAALLSSARWSGTVERHGRREVERPRMV